MKNLAQESRLPLILTIDDDDITRLMLQNILSSEGFEVLGASDGQTGLEMFDERRPDLILLDIMMPEMDGFACLKVLRSAPCNSLLPIIMLTGIDDIESIHRCFDLGATDFIAKPINWPTLPYRLRYMMRASEALVSLARSETALSNAQKIAHLGNWDWDINTNRMACSKEALNVLGVAEADFNGQRLDFFKTVHPSDIPHLHEALELCAKRGRPFSFEIRLGHADETAHMARIQAEAKMLLGQVETVHGTVQDITEQRQIEGQVHHLSYYDALTGLPNRTLFKEILKLAINYCDRYGVLLAGLFVGIDRFKRINETLGEAIGDRILQMFVERLIHAVRDCDHTAVARDLEMDFEIRDDSTDITVARLGDSEFAIMLNYIRDTSDSAKVAEQIFKEMASPFEVEGNEIYLAANIGITVYPADAQDADTFIKNGEFALNHAREQGQNSHQFFSKPLNVAAFQKLSMENGLRHAIERDELILHYQPLINLQHNQVVGTEALLRWQHPQFGLVAPALFIPIAEDSGLIGSIGHWVLTTACRQLRTWQLEGMTALMVSVNVSVFQLRHNDFSLHVREILGSTGLAAENLKLELTENILMEENSDAMTTLIKIRAMGVGISIDDFGSGHSSLSYLKKLPISELKIDRSFVKDIPHNEDDKVITSAIINLAKNLSLEVVAKGVENEQQLAFMRLHACDAVQGYFYSKPLPQAEFAKFVEQNHIKHDQ